MKRNRNIVVLALLIVFIASCASTPSNRSTEYSLLMTSKQAYDTGFTVLAALDKSGKLSAKDKATATDLGNKYMAVHNAAVQDMIAGKSINMTLVSTALAAFTQFIAPLIGGK